MRSIIRFTRGRGTLERLACFLFLLLLLLLLFSLTLGGTLAALSSRDCLFIARTELSTICYRGLIIGLKCLSNAMFSSILPVFRTWCFLRIDSLVFSISLAIFSRARQPCSSLANDNDYSRSNIANSLNSFLYLPSLSALSLSITKNPYFVCQQSRYNKQNSLYDISVFTWSSCFKLVQSYLNRINRFALSRITCLGILAYVWQR